MTNIDISVERPWLFLILIPALVLGIIPFLRLKKNRRTSTKHLIPFIIHLSLIFLLSSLLAGVQVNETSDEPIETKVVFVVDVSESNIHTKDKMNKYIKDVISTSDIELTKFATVLFANEVIDVVDSDKFNLEASDFLEFDSNGVKTDQTNIADAIKEASELFNREKQNKKIVLMSDGLETLGKGSSVASSFDNDIHVSGVHFSTVEEGTDNKEVQLIYVEPVSNRVAKDEDVTIEVAIRSTKYVGAATITVYEGDNDKASDKITLEKGLTTCSLSYAPENSGMNAVRVEISVNGDLISQNNTLYTWYTLDKKKTALVVDGDYGKKVSQWDQIKNSPVLQELKDYDIPKRPISPAAFPNDLEDLLKYDQIILMDVDFADLPPTAATNLKRYVQEVGRGLFVSFGDNLYNVNKDDYKKSPISEILPVELSIKEERETVAMVIIVDLSSSMKQGMSGSTEARYDIVLESTKNVLKLESFADTDYVGVVVFDQDTHIALEMQQLGDAKSREAICEKIEYEIDHYYYAYYLDEEGEESDIRINTKEHGKPGNNKYEKLGYSFPEGWDKGGGTNSKGDQITTYGTSYKGAIQAASNMLSKKNNETKLHIKQAVLMSDGAPNDQGSGYVGIVERMAKSGTNFSTIAIGKDEEGGLEELSTLAIKGNGDFQIAIKASDVSESLVKKAEEVSGEKLNERTVQPYRTSSYDSSVLKGVDYYSKINGYYSSTIKPEASMLLYVDNQKPLYAEWNYGLGRVSVYMSDLGRAEWTGDLYQEQLVEKDGETVVERDGITLISNMIHAVMNRNVESTGLEYSSIRNEEATSIVVDTPVNVRDGEALVAMFVDQDGKPVDGEFFSFEKIGTKRYRSIVPTKNAQATYFIKLMLINMNTNKINDTVTFAETGYYNSEYNVFDDRGLSTLQSVSNNGNGSMLVDLTTFYDDVKNEIQVYNHNINTPAIIAGLVLFVADIIFRNFAMKKKNKEKIQMTDEQQIASMKGR